MSFHAYPNFDGNCREAFTRYQDIFGGELAIVTMGDMPAEEQAEVPPGMADMVMNAALECDHGLLMGSDAPPGTWQPSTAVYITVAVPDVAEAERVWKELGDGGDVQMDLAATSWSPAFGMVRDRFGVPWMINTDAPQS